MRIEFVEIQNFRKLKSIRIDFAEQTTLFVGANNSGKTSAMDALVRFLVSKRFSTNEFTLSNWAQINKIGASWERQSTQTGSQIPTLAEWEKLLPTMGVWLQVAENEIHHVIHLLPTLDWEGGMLGVRLRFEPKNIENFYKEYVVARKAARDTLNEATKAEGNDKDPLDLWPKTIVDFLDRRLNGLFDVRAYNLDQSKLVDLKKGVAQPQPLPAGSEYLDGDPLRGLIRIDEINAQRGLADVNNEKIQSGTDNQPHGDRRKLSSQLHSYYKKHLDPTELPDPSDIDALRAVVTAQTAFDDKLKTAFENALTELECLGYPGVTDPRLTISTKIQPIDGLDHPSAVQFQLRNNGGEDQEIPLRLPEQYNGLGYQNLISMVFRLMSFRDDRMRVGKAGKKAAAETTEASFSPLHLVLIEEPEAHLHAQVQQVFVRKAYALLRNHDDLKDTASLATQLVVSTHSSHVAHECDFACLRYFRRLPAQKGLNEIPTATVVNLSEVFGSNDDTQRFVTRYLKTTHCDLFFADAAILVEGPAERMLIPNFISKHFKKLHQSYITVLEIGGSHAHRLQPLIDHLGLTTLIVTDLDAKEREGSAAAQPMRGQNMVTRNATLKKWVPKKEPIDELLDLKFEEKVKENDQFYAVRGAYQHPVKVRLNGEGKEEEALPNTFEDALVFENLSMFKDLDGHGLIKKFNDAIKNAESVATLGRTMFDELKTGKKAEFALEILDLPEPNQLKVPTYINEGLSWLQEQVQLKQKEIIIPDESSAPDGQGAH